jgi:MoxR-like ATPase
VTTPTAPKSCLTCPSYLVDPGDQVRAIKKSLGAPICGRFGRVLGRPGQTDAQAEKLGKHFGSTCPAWGEPAPVQPTALKFEVALPIMELRETVPTSSPEWQAATTCGVCRNFIAERAVGKELGWTAGMCGAKGRLILTTRQSIEARDCEFRATGQARVRADDLVLLPEYEDAFNLSVSPIASYFKKQRDGVVDPADYPTDKEITPADKLAGIRAWRRIADPAGSGNEAFLPIYDTDFFSPEEQAKIPLSGSDEHPELYIDHFGGLYALAVCWTELDETPILWGDAGTGKTEAFRFAAWMMNLPFERISITAQTDVDDLIGTTRFTNNETWFAYGRLPLAWQKPCVMVVDEPNVGPNEVMQAIRPLIDNSKQLVIDQHDHERIERHNDCYLGFAANPAWDVRNVGANQLADADQSRMFHIFVDLPPNELEREILRHRCESDGWQLDKPREEALMKTAAELRGLSKDGILPVSWGIRPQIKVARALRWFDPVTAYLRAVGDYLEPQAREALLAAVRANFRGLR